MKLSFRCTTLEQVDAGIAVVFIFENTDLFRDRTSRLNKLSGGLLTPTIAAGDFKGKEGEVITLYPKSGLRFARLVVAGLGDRKKLTLEKLRRAAAATTRPARNHAMRSIAFEMIKFALLKDVLQCTYGEVAMAIAEGSALSMYGFDKYLTAETKKIKKLAEFLLFDADRRFLKEGSAAITTAGIVRDAVFHARDLSNAPANEIFPDALADAVRSSARRHGYAARSFDVKRIRSLGMGGLLAVSQGSARPPHFLILEYGKGKRNADTVVLVGKGVTFDSGGISIKPSAGMSEMKMDMSGAAVVLSTFEACARLRLNVHLVGLIPATENMPGGRAIKPGDIIRQYNGKTTEIENTDAEGRLILADALGYASKFKPNAVIDLATLTGACVVALGQHATGMMGTSDELMERLTAAGARTYERVWRLPLFEEYEKQIRSDIADVKNVGGRWAGAITAGMFLKKFIGDYPWVHLDIAGTAMSEEASDYIPKGGTGVGTRLLIDLLQNWKRFP